MMFGISGKIEAKFLFENDGDSRVTFVDRHGKKHTAEDLDCDLESLHKKYLGVSACREYLIGGNMFHSCTPPKSIVWDREYTKFLGISVEE